MMPRDKIELPEEVYDFLYNYVETGMIGNFEEMVEKIVSRATMSARIDELDNLPLIRMNFINDFAYVINKKLLDKRIAQLKAQKANVKFKLC